jgi:hypothetical protein
MMKLLMYTHTHTYLYSYIPHTHIQGAKHRFVICDEVVHVQTHTYILIRIHTYTHTYRVRRVVLSSMMKLLINTGISLSGEAGPSLWKSGIYMYLYVYMCTYICSLSWIYKPTCMHACMPVTIY